MSCLVMFKVPISLDLPKAATWCCSSIRLLSEKSEYTLIGHAYSVLFSNELQEVWGWLSSRIIMSFENSFYLNSCYFLMEESITSTASKRNVSRRFVVMSLSKFYIPPPPPPESLLVSASLGETDNILPSLDFCNCTFHICFIPKVTTGAKTTGKNRSVETNLWHGLCQSHFFWGHQSKACKPKFFQLT